jgi:hypothetical protein
LSLNTKLKAEIIIDFGELRPLISWLERNCTSEWGYTCIIPAGRDAGAYDFYFESERDLVAFTMWKQ